MNKVAVVVFPGSNCDRDAHYAFDRILKKETVFHWHMDDIMPGQYSLVILPGGFSYGDYLRAGAMAKVSPAVISLQKHIDHGGFVLGICNGFQTLVEAGYLPGVLSKNADNRFHCHDIFIQAQTTNSPFLKQTPNAQALRMPIAHSQGRYDVDAKTFEELQKNDQIAFRYVNNVGEKTADANFNGSFDSIAGVMNKQKNVLGMMPHPERCSDPVLGNTDGLLFLRSIGASL